MPDKYKQTQHIEQVQGDANYHYHHHEAPRSQPPVPPLGQPANAKAKRWGVAGGLIAALALGGTLVTTQLNARPVYYCASHNTVKYHTNRNCSALEQCGSRVRSMSLGRAQGKMDLCRVCH